MTFYSHKSKSQIARHFPEHNYPTAHLNYPIYFFPPFLAFNYTNASICQYTFMLFLAVFFRSPNYLATSFKYAVTFSINGTILTLSNYLIIGLHNAKDFYGNCLAHYMMTLLNFPMLVLFNNHYQGGHAMVAWLPQVNLPTKAVIALLCESRCPLREELPCIFVYR